MRGCGSCLRPFAFGGVGRDESQYPSGDASGAVAALDQPLVEPAVAHGAASDGCRGNVPNLCVRLNGGYDLSFIHSRIRGQLSPHVKGDYCPLAPDHREG